MVHDRGSETIYPPMQRKGYAYEKAYFPLSFYLSNICLSICLSVRLSMYLSTYQPIILIKKGIDLSFSLFEGER